MYRLESGMNRVKLNIGTFWMIRTSEALMSFRKIRAKVGTPKGVRIVYSFRL